MKHMVFFGVLLLAFIAACTPGDDTAGGESITGNVVAEPPVQELSFGGDYLDAVPASVYEGSEMNPQNMDYNAADKLFVAHSGWINDKLVHYYKFRMYTPLTYPGKIAPGQNNNVQTMPVYVLTTTGGLDGVVDYVFPQYPGGGDEQVYSDFVQVHFVTVDEETAGKIKSASDIIDNGLDVKETTDYLNAPIVPNGARLQDIDGESIAPINAVQGWYKGQRVEFFVFEVTTQEWADHFNPLSREGDAGTEGSGYEVSVVLGMVLSPDSVANIPIWHFNQYSFGVETGVNNGGPFNGGQRNVIDADRNDEDYSPLWQVFWISKLPLGYEADHASDAADITEENGFEVIQTPMFVNCPNIGPHGGAGLNENKADAFNVINNKAMIRGALVMQGGKEVVAEINGKNVDSAVTGMMGEYALAAPLGLMHTGDVVVKDAEGNTVNEFSLPK